MMLAAYIKPFNTLHNVASSRKAVDKHSPDARILAALIILLILQALNKVIVR